MPPSHGPQLNATTRQLASRLDIFWAHLFKYSLAAPYAAWPIRPYRAVDDENRARN